MRGRNISSKNCLAKTKQLLDSQNSENFFQRKIRFWERMDARAGHSTLWKKGVSGENVTRGGKVSLVMNLNYSLYCILSRLDSPKVAISFTFC